MKRAAAKIVPQLLKLLVEQKQRRMDIAQDRLRMFNDDPVLIKKFITGDQ